MELQELVNAVTKADMLITQVRDTNDAVNVLGRRLTTVSDDILSVDGSIDTLTKTNNVILLEVRALNNYVETSIQALSDKMAELIGVASIVPEVVSHTAYIEPVVQPKVKQEWFTTREASAYLDVPVGEIYHLKKYGSIVKQKPNGKGRGLYSRECLDNVRAKHIEGLPHD